MCDGSRHFVVIGFEAINQWIESGATITKVLLWRHLSGHRKLDVQYACTPVVSKPKLLKFASLPEHKQRTVQETCRQEAEGFQHVPNVP